MYFHDLFFKILSNMDKVILYCIKSGKKKLQDVHLKKNVSRFLKIKSLVPFILKQM